MVEKKEVVQIFEDEKLRKCSIYLYRDFHKITEVIEKSGISRGKVYEVLDPFKISKGKYEEEYVEQKFAIRGKRRRLSQKILVDWLSYELDFSNEEEGSLLEIVNEEPIDKILRKESRTWNTVIAKLIFSAIFIKLRAESNTEEKIQELPSFLNAELVKNLDLFKEISKEELEDFLVALQELADEKKADLSRKIIDSDIIVCFPSTDWAFMFEAISKVAAAMLLDYYDNLTKDPGDLALRILRSPGSDKDAERPIQDLLFETLKGKSSNLNSFLNSEDK